MRGRGETGATAAASAGRGVPQGLEHRPGALPVLVPGVRGVGLGLVAQALVEAPLGPGQALAAYDRVQELLALAARRVRGAARHGHVVREREPARELGRD